MCSRVAVLALAAVVAGARAEAATLRSAHAAIAILPDGTCDVRMRFVTASDAPLTSEHRLLVSGSAAVEEVVVEGVSAGAVRRAGRSLVVPVSIPAGEVEYAARYRVGQRAGAGWCGLLVPDVPTAGLGRVVRIDAALPGGMRRLPGEFPAMRWEESRGTVTLGHVPAFAAVPYARPGEAVGWRRSFDIRRTLDTAAVAFLLAASVVWAASRRRRR